MAVYLIGQINIKDDNLWQKYVSGVAASLSPFDAKIIFRGKRHSVLAGENEFELVVVIQFSGQGILNSWFHSSQYQALIPLRDKAADVVITTYETY